MTQQDPPLKPKKDKPIEDLLNKDSRMMRSPVLWFVLLLIPVLAAFYVGLTTDNNAAPVVQQEVVEYTPENPVAPPPPLPVMGQPEGAKGVRNTARPGIEAARAADVSDKAVGRGTSVCGYSEWVGKKADAALEEKIKADGRAYRILPPGTMMTQDFSENRLNFETDAGGIITRVWCG